MNEINGKLRFRRTARAAAIVLLLVAAGWGLAALATRGREVPVVAPFRGDLMETVVATGRVTDLARVEVASEIIGTAAEVTVRAGDEVRAGQLLVRLDDAQARSEMSQARAAVAAAEARRRQLQGVAGPVAEESLHETQADLDRASSEYARVEALVAKGVASRQELDEALRALEVARARRAREEVRARAVRPGGDDLLVAEADLAQAQAALAVAETRLARALIIAPGQGRIVNRSVEVGDVVQPGRVLLVLSRPGRTEIAAWVDEKNLRLLAPGQPAGVLADAYPGSPFRGALSRIVPAVDPQRGAVEVRLEVPAPPAFLLPDMTVSVEIETARRSGVLLIPAAALRDLAGNPWALVAERGRAVRRAVAVGIRGEGSVEIVGGLSPGDPVIPPSITGVYVGSRVRPKQAGSAAGR